MKSTLSESDRTAFAVEIARVEKENTDLRVSETGEITAEMYASMYDMELEPGDNLMDLIFRQFDKKQKILYPTMGLKRLTAEVAAEEDEFIRRRPVPAPAPPAPPPGIVIGEPVPITGVSRVCTVTDPDEGSTRKKAKKSHPQRPAVEVMEEDFNENDS